MSALLLHVASEAQLFAIVFGAGCEKLFGSTNTYCERAFGLCSLPGAMQSARAIVRCKMNGCVWQNALLSCFDARTGSFFDSYLSVYALTVPAFAVRSQFRLQIYADLFGVFFGSGGGAWRSLRKLARIEAPRSMPTVGRIWV